MGYPQSHLSSTTRVGCYCKKGFARCPKPINDARPALPHAPKCHRRPRTRYFYSPTCGNRSPSWPPTHWYGYCAPPPFSLPFFLHPHPIRSLAHLQLHPLKSISSSHTTILPLKAKARLSMTMAKATISIPLSPWLSLCTKASSGAKGAATTTHSLGNIRATPGYPSYHGYRSYAS